MFKTDILTMKNFSKKENVSKKELKFIKKVECLKKYLNDNFKPSNKKSK
jgi:hypothetical protein